MTAQSRLNHPLRHQALGREDDAKDGNDRQQRGGAKLSPRWATRYDLRGSLSNGVHEEIQASFERLKQDGLGRTAHAHLCSTTTTDYGSSSASSSTLTFTRVDSSAASSNSSAAYASMMGSLSSGTVTGGKRALAQARGTSDVRAPKLKSNGVTPQ